MLCKRASTRVSRSLRAGNALHQAERMANLIFDLLAIVIVVLALTALALFAPAVLRRAAAAIRDAFRPKG